MSIKLYNKLLQPVFRSYPYEVRELGEGMTLIKESICGWWKPRFLVDNRAREAFEFLTPNEYFVKFSPANVDWDTLEKLPEEVKDRAKRGYAGFPTFLDSFNGGMVKVYWQINPDGQYFMDEDGYGMTDDEKIELIGAIDRTGKVIEKYRLCK